jgi:hypothetical protein
MHDQAERWSIADWSFERGPLVEVLWIDSGSSSGWTKRADELSNPNRFEAMRCATVGYLVEDTPLWITLALSCNANDQISEMMTIPRVAIMEVVHLTRTSPSLAPAEDEAA